MTILGHMRDGSQGRRTVSMYSPLGARLDMLGSWVV